MRTRRLACRHRALTPRAAALRADFASVQAALLVHSGTSWWQRMKNHVEFFAVVA